MSTKIPGLSLVPILAFSFLNVLSMPSLASSDILVYEEQFEDGPNGWTHGGRSDQWTLGSPNRLVGSAPYMGLTQVPAGDSWNTNPGLTFDAETDSWLQSPSLRIPPGDAVAFTWWEAFCFDQFWPVLAFANLNPGALGTETVAVEVRGAAETGWTQVAETGGIVDYCHDAWRPRAADLSPWANTTVQIRFHFVSTSLWVDKIGSWTLDDVEIKATVDLDGDAAWIAGLLGTEPPSNPKTHSNADGSTTVYDDKNANGQVDNGETLATTPPTSGNVPVPGQGASQTVGAQSSPGVHSQSATTPSVEGPATCSVEVCNAPTTISGTTVTTPPVEPMSLATPAVPVGQQCIPLLVCVGPFTVPSQNVGTTPGAGPQSVPVPDQTLPPLCGVAGAICLPATTLLAPETVATPEQGPIPLTPAITVAFGVAPSSASINPHAGQFGSIGPISTTVPVPFIGNVPVTLCPQTCPVPVAADVSYHGSVTVRVAVGSTVQEATVPVDVG